MFYMDAADITYPPPPHNDNYGVLEYKELLSSYGLADAGAPKHMTDLLHLKL